MKDQPYYKKRAQRLAPRRLRSMLRYRFLTAYGYEKGPVIVDAIVDDILELIEQYYITPRHQRVGQIIWLAPHKDENQHKGKTIASTRLVPIKLNLIAEEDHELLAQGASMRERQKARIRRLFLEAFEQDALLTNLEVGILIGRSEYAVNKVVSEYRDQGVNLPTRGWVHDIGRGPSHKKIILEYYLEGMLTPDIAARTYHHPSAVDRYIKNFEVVRGLAQRFRAEEIPPLARMQPIVVNEYLEVLKAHGMLPRMLQETAAD